MGSLGTLKHALQTKFSPIKKLSGFTKVMNKVQNIKNDKFSFKWPKRLQAFKICIKYNKKLIQAYPETGKIPNLRGQQKYMFPVWCSLMD